MNGNPLESPLRVLHGSQEVGFVPTIDFRRPLNDHRPSPASPAGSGKHVIKDTRDIRFWSSKVALYSPRRGRQPIGHSRVLVAGARSQQYRMVSLVTFMRTRSMRPGQIGQIHIFQRTGLLYSSLTNVSIHLQRGLTTSTFLLCTLSLAARVWGQC